MTYGYARVSTKGQRDHGNGLDVQVRDLTLAGCEEIYSEAYTGTKTDRPELQKLLSVVEPGDTIVVTKLDRIARSTVDGINLIQPLLDRGITVHILNMGRMDNTPTGRLTMHIFMAFAEFERDMIVTRTREGKEMARQKPGYKEGRPRVKNADMFDELYTAVGAGALTVAEAIEKMGCSRRTWFTYAKAYANN